MTTQTQTLQPYRPSLIKDPRSRIAFLLTDCPRPDGSIPTSYAPILKEHNITYVLRLCDASQYDSQELASEGIEVIDWPFEDGSAPPDTIILSFRSFLASLPPSSTIAIHCVSGIGRAPVLATVGLIDSGIDPMEAVEIVRKHRRGALNKKQLAWLLDEKGGLKKIKAGKVAKDKDKDGGGEGKKKGLFGGLFGKK
ncbi:Protein tyrosine phosphatase type IVA 3 [Rhizophlyctis rosea]|nr:Protein tyrosine phosphatase type IVA 3 [Rhizophlyctis rosea]